MIIWHNYEEIQKTETIIADIDVTVYYNALLKNWNIYSRKMDIDTGMVAHNMEYAKREAISVVHRTLHSRVIEYKRIMEHIEEVNDE